MNVCIPDEADRANGRCPGEGFTADRIGGDENFLPTIKAFINARPLPSALIGLVLATVITFWPVVHYDFVAWDDPLHVFDNKYVHNFGEKSLKYFWTTPHQGLYIPLSYTVWGTLGKLAKTGENPDKSPRYEQAVFHVANLCLHLANVLLVFFIVRLLSRSNWASFFGALLFSLHPIQVEAVAWVSELKGLLCSFFSLAAAYAYLRFAVDSREAEGSREDAAGAETGDPPQFPHPGIAQDGKKNRAYPFAWLWPLIRPLDQGQNARLYFLGILLYTLGLLSKPTTIILPGILFCLDYFLIRRNFGAIVRNLSLWCIPALGFAIVARLAQPESYLEFTPQIFERPLIALDAVTFYLYKLIFPSELCIDYGHQPEKVLWNWWGSFTWIPAIILGMAAWFGGRKKPWMRAAFLIFVIAIFPVSGIFPFAFQNFSTTSDRYLYVPMLGAALAIAFFLRDKLNRFVVLSSIVILGLLAILSSEQVRTWENSFILFEHTIEINPQSSMSYNNYGAVLSYYGHFRQAPYYYFKALEIKPDYFDSYTNIANNYMKQGRYKEVLYYFRRALLARPGRMDISKEVGVNLLKIGMFAEAMTFLMPLAPKLQNDAEVYNAIGIAYYKLRNTEKAERYYNTALRINPGFIHAMNNLGILFQEKGDEEKAVFYYRKAMETDPKEPESYSNYAQVLLKKGETDEAVKLYLKSLEKNPKYLEALIALGEIMYRRGNIAEARAYFQRAYKAEPRLKEAVEGMKKVGLL